MLLAAVGRFRGLCGLSRLFGFSAATLASFLFLFGRFHFYDKRIEFRPSLTFIMQIQGGFYTLEKRFE